MGVFTLSSPVFAGAPAPTVTRSATLNGQPVATAGDSYVGAYKGDLGVTWTATNGHGNLATSSAAATIEAASPADWGLTDGPGTITAKPTVQTLTLIGGAGSIMIED